jgi:hypothetical protein
MAIASLTLLAVAVALLARLHFAPTGLDPVRNAVSDYGTTPWHRSYRAMVIALGLAAALLAAELAYETNADDLIWLWTFAASRIAIAGFMTDRDPPPFTREGLVHYALATAAFTSIAIAASNIDWSGKPAVLDPLGTAIVLSAILTVATFRVPAVFGLVERALYATSIAWLAIAAIDLA